MKILLFLAILMTGCSSNTPENYKSAPPTQNLLHPYQLDNDTSSSTLPIANPITTQTITEPNLVLGIIVGTAIALFSLKRN